VANALYGKFKQALLTQSPSVNFVSGTIKATLIDAGNYTVSINVDQYMNTSTIPAIAKIGSPQTLGTKTETLGVFDAADITFSAVTGASVEAIVLWLDGGGGGTSASGTTDPLIAYIDTGSNLPVTPNGGDIVVTWNASGIFAL
jgi:hypothetical protein